MSIAPEVMSPRDRGYFTPILWEPDRSLERSASEWSLLRERFAAAREGDFSALADLPDRYPALKDRAARVFARSLLGDAGTDTQLEAVGSYVGEEVLEADRVCELCRSLALWGRLSAVDPILVAYDRNFPAQYAEALPGYLSVMLEDEAGPAADAPREDTVEAFVAYETAVRKLHATRVGTLGGELAYVALGEAFGVERTARHLLGRLGSGGRDAVLAPFLRQRFEASTGIDCSGFFRDGDARPLTMATELEAWLEGPAPRRFTPGERYFFGHQIPR